METKQFESKMYNYVKGKGFPVLLSVAKTNDEQEDVIEIIKLYYNGNEEIKEFSHRIIDIIKIGRSSFIEKMGGIKTVLKIGLNILENEVNRENSSNSDFVPITEKTNDHDSDFDLLFLLQSAPNFSEIRGHIINKTFSENLRGRIKGLKGSGIPFTEFENLGL